MDRNTGVVANRDYRLNSGIDCELGNFERIGVPSLAERTILSDGLSVAGAVTGLSLPTDHCRPEYRVGCSEGEGRSSSQIPNPVPLCGQTAAPTKLFFRRSIGPKSGSDSGAASESCTGPGGSIESEVGQSVHFLAIRAFPTAVAFIFGFGIASWQFTSPRTVPTGSAQVEIPTTDLTEVRGLDAAAGRGHSTAEARIVGTSTVALLPLNGNETAATSRHIDLLRTEISEVHRRIVRIEERVDGAIKEARDLALTPVPIAAEKLMRLEQAHAERITGANPIPPIEHLVEADATQTASTPGWIVGEAATAGIASAPLASKETSSRDKNDTARSELPKNKTATPKDQKSERPKNETKKVETSLKPIPTVTALNEKPTSSVEATPNVSTPSVIWAPAKAEITAIDLGGYPTLAALRMSWFNMTLRYDDLGKGLAPLARMSETNTGIEARLIAGPFSNRGDAASACAHLKAAGVACSVAPYDGEPITGVR